MRGVLLRSLAREASPQLRSRCDGVLVAFRRKLARHPLWKESFITPELLGISGAQSSNRPGYQRLISMVALREVGILFGLEVSRLARNCLYWYQLLELAAAFNVLIGDEDGSQLARQQECRLRGATA